MGEELWRLSKRRKALNQLHEIEERQNTTLVVHYSCESFYDRSDGSTPRITSIAVHNFTSGQTESFSIHKIAELDNLLNTEIVDRYNHLERRMLDEFFDFLKMNEKYTWVHWNMRDINYGFQAIEHRYRVLGGNPIRLPEERKFDLARALMNVYGKNYIGHPRLESLTKKNKISDIGYLNGPDEAIAFEAREFVKLHQSTLRKVNVIANILEQTLEGNLKTDAKWYQVYGFHPKALLEIITEHWCWSLAGVIATIITILTVFR
ncbi:hypothetical protein VB712_10865 [Spirulina sp. CCNP1310]|uniref:hypothetical protein n=1 Tax=Spirulina sp. CCNP1310 TaxID=3110249 RepID=UPI002B21D555|nr:hypothetical protein [Spirulina sp. CCNP1310]MEA5419724.1 hypothetical protein [Spirulina sp. CCNP1310]